MLLCVIALLALVSCGAQQAAAAAAPSLAGWKTVKLNIATEARDGYLLVPPTYKAGQLSPLLVLLHGAGKDAHEAVASILTADDAHALSAQRCLVLVSESRGPDWDLIISGQYGPDLLYIKNALAFTLTHYKINRGRMALAGFSDGATYALSLGLTGGLFNYLIAFSPGGFVPPAGQVNDVSVFISHGIEDKLFPIQHTSRLILSQLRQLLPRNNIVYVEFKGGHEVPAAVSKEALEWFLEGKPVIGAKYSQKG